MSRMFRHWLGRPAVARPVSPKRPTSPRARLLVQALGAQPPVFTLGLPLAIAFAAAGLGFGVALANGWSFRTRLKAH